MNDDLKKHIENEKAKLIRRIWPNALSFVRNAAPLTVNIKQIIKSNDSPRLIFTSSDPGKIYRLGIELVESGVGNRSIQFDDLNIVRVDGPRNNQWIVPDFLPKTRTKSVVLCPTICDTQIVLDTFITSWFNKGTKVIGICTNMQLEKQYHNVVNLDAANLRL